MKACRMNTLTRKPYTVADKELALFCQTTKSAVTGERTVCGNDFVTGIADRIGVARHNTTDRPRGSFTRARQFFICRHLPFWYFFEQPDSRMERSFFHAGIFITARRAVPAA